MCAEVPTTTCKVVPFADCRQTSSTVRFNVSVIDVDDFFVPFTCVNDTKVELQRKLVPKCVNVTRQDCVTKWELNNLGAKVSR